ncbi:hypothetical protein FBD94_22960 [Pedobacter hiemivivus]|uniref:Uncharacterized protein n=1 Tax=Pedobacter hiemivivus TaxID=2530454 RepID=A0A4U1FZH4_9SPHI|nr:hypothetical protein [Pedobacter hiemivivus]TCC96652.1 hypothetical protein EZ444_11845 [Pedobacter hiemivivus]TKC56575.1 hypothetical protein FBD94_22960 [Pedobacter hiemivivus]
MPLEESYSLTTKEGHEYRIGFSPFDIFATPKSLTKPIVDVVIAIDDNKGINNASTLFEFSKIIKEYLFKNDVILYCYCDNKEIERGKKHQHLSPQEYRSLLFEKMFDKASNKDFINKPILLIDATDNKHCIHFFSSTQNLDQIELLSEELYKAKG